MEKLLKELIELQRSSIRLQKFQTSLLSECVTYLHMRATKPAAKPDEIEKQVWTTIQRMRKTLEKVEHGKSLPR